MRTNRRNGAYKLQDVATALRRRQQARSDLNVWTATDEMQQDREIQRVNGMNPELPLYGIPIAVKDIIYTADLPTEHGSPRYKGSQVFHDASVVTILRQAGALIWGKTVTTEYANTMTGQATRNPCNPKHTPGGSSSGSAAAVADYQVPIAIGSQTLGSIVRPASFCGILGYKPTYGSVPHHGCRGYAPSLDTLGFFSRSVRDFGLICDALKITDAHTSSFSCIKGSRIAVLRLQPVWEKTKPDAEQALQTACSLLHESGASVQQITLPTSFNRWQEWQQCVFYKELAINMLSETCTGRENMDEMLLGFIDKGDSIPLNEYTTALDQLAALRGRFDAIAGQYDAIMTLGTPGEAPEGLEWTGDSSYCALWTVRNADIINASLTACAGFACSCCQRSRCDRRQRPADRHSIDQSQI